jgi:hypothetical protein
VFSDGLTGLPPNTVGDSTMKRLAMVTTARGYFFRFRNAYLSHRQIENRFRKSSTDFYSGIYSIDNRSSPPYYSRQIVQHLPLAGNFIIDIDAHSHSEKKRAVPAVKGALEKLQSFGAPYILYHSGRGFHIDVPSALCVPNLPLLHRVFVDEITPHADTSIYNQYRVIRHPLSLNLKSGTFKNAIDKIDLDLSEDQLKDKLLEPQKEISNIPPSREFDQAVIDVFHTYDEEKKKCLSIRDFSNIRLQKLPVKDDISLRARRVFHTADIEPNTRHKHTLYLAYDFRCAQYDEEKTRYLLIGWARWIFEKGLSQSQWNEIKIDTHKIVDHVYAQQNCWRPYHFVEEIKRGYKKNYENGKKTKKFEKKPNQCKVLYVFRAAAKIFPKFFLSYSMIESVTQLKTLRNRATNYVKSLEDQGYFERIPSYEAQGFIERSDELPNTNCYHYLHS